MVTDEIKTYNDKVFSKIDIYAKSAIIKLYVNLDKIDLDKKHNLYWLCGKLKLNYSYCSQIINKFEDSGFLNTCIVGRETLIEFTAKGLQLHLILTSFCDQFSEV